LATIGKVAAKELEAQIMKREAMRRPLKAVSPPPEPQLRGGEDDMFGSSKWGSKLARMGYKPDQLAK
jgi:hypothetical protein